MGATARAPPFGLPCLHYNHVHCAQPPFCLISFSIAGNPHSKQECESSTPPTTLAYKRRRLTFEYLLAGPFVQCQTGPHHVQVGRIGCPPHKHRGGPLDHCLEDSDHLSLLLVTAHFSMAPPHSWRCPNCDLKSHSSASHSGTLENGQFQHHDRIVFQTSQETLESHVSDDKGAWRCGP